VAFVFLRHDPFTMTLVGVAVVIVVARLAGRLFEWLHQPPVIGEVIAGIALGPSLLGDTSSSLFPSEGRPLLKMLATLGLVTFMFIVGLGLDLSHLRGRHRVVGSVALFGTLVPFVLGIGLAGVLHPHHDSGRFVPFALFMGAAMSITALPVLVRILRERGIDDKPLGVVAIACAAANDLMTWTSLALVVAVVGSAGGWDVPYVIAASAAFVLLLWTVVRPRLGRFADVQLTDPALSLVMAAVLTCSFVTSAIGVHEVFGAFLLGVVFPRGSFSVALSDRLGSVTYVLLPVFFVTSGLNVDLRALGPDEAWQLGLVLLVAFGGKILGGTFGARVQGMRPRESVALGLLMNTRGLTELIVLNIGLELGVLDMELFSLLVVMAVVTTVATGPLLAVLRPDPYLSESPRTRSDSARRTRAGILPTQSPSGVVGDGDLRPALETGPSLSAVTGDPT
jgi:Kef-type K+ transport system membrane component KefB